MSHIQIKPAPPCSEQATPLDLAALYDRRFFTGLAESSEKSANVVVPLVLERYPVKSVVDVGCGTGVWLNVFAQHAVADLQGVDGEYVDRSLLQIPADRFAPADLALPLKLGRRFDLAVCLEVAEHLPPSSAPILAESLTELADVVLFSAAAPGQGGTNHINEQWPDYWAELFRNHGFTAIDCIRPLIWSNTDVDWWYAQNMMIFASKSAIQAHPALKRGDISAGGAPLRLIHPRLFGVVHGELESLHNHERTPSVTWCARAISLSIRNAVHRRLPWSSGEPS